jgi:hypothetical protein
LHLASARPAPEVYPTAGRSALALNPQTDPIAQPWTGAAPAPQNSVPAQGTLFQMTETGRVVPIRSFQNRGAQQGPTPRAQRQAKHPVARTNGGFQTVAEFEQGFLNFNGQNGGARRSGVADHSRFSKAPVAVPMHRLMSALLDYTLVIIASAMVGVVLYFVMGREAFTVQTLAYLGAMTVLFGIGYKALFAMAGVESPGLRWTQLRLLTWDGSQPTRQDRLRRLAWGCASILPAGLGLLWSLVDEETLSWHDHSSKTFLTSIPATRGYQSAR